MKHHYAKQLATEALVVGISSVVAFSIVSSVLPTVGVIEKTFIAGAGLHLTFEGLGLNHWYLFHGAASYPREKSSASHTRCQE